MKRYILPIAALCLGLAADAQTIDEDIDETYLTLATPPADLTTTTYRMEAFETSVGKNLDYHVQLGFAGNEVWIQGISEAFPESWVKGEMEGDRLIIGMDQYLGIYDLNGTNYNIWVTGINHGLARFEEPQFTYNPNTGIFTQIDGNWLVVNGSLTEWKWLNNMSDIMLSPVTDEEELVDHYALVTPPAGVGTDEFCTTTFTASGFDYSFGTPDPLASYPVELGFAPSAQGDATVYARGLFADMPDAWVKGTAALDGSGAPASLTFPSPQYMGQWYGSLDCWLMGVDADEEAVSVTFTYDADQGAFVQQPDVRIYFNDAYDAPSPMALQMVGGLTLQGDCSSLLDGITPVLAAPGARPESEFILRRVYPEHVEGKERFGHQRYNLSGQPAGGAFHCPTPGISIEGGKKCLWKK